MPKLADDLKEKIRELQKMGLSDGEIAKKFNISYSIVHYQRPEVKERKREYMREYYQRPEVKERRREYMREYNHYQKLDPALEKFLELSILKCLSGSNYGRTHKQIIREVKRNFKFTRNFELREIKRVVPQLKKLSNHGFVKYDEIEHRYSLTDKGRNSPLEVIAFLNLDEFVKYDEIEHRYSLTDKGRNLVKDLFKDEFI